MRRILAAVGICFLALTAVPSRVEAKSYSVPSVTIDATVNADGSMDVRETYVYDFVGSFSKITRPIDRGDYYEVTDFEVSEGGRRLAVDGAPYDASWGVSAFNDRHRYEVAFHVEGAVQVGPDVGELYWQFVGTEHPLVSNCNITVTFPSAGLKAWGHGPTHGRVSINGEVVTLAAGFVPAGQFVEARIVAPSASFTVVPSGDRRLPRVQAEEIALVRDTLREQGYSEAEIDELQDEAFGSTAARQDQARQRRLIPEIILMAVVALLGLVAYLLLWLRWGNDPEPERDPGEYWRELPTEPPAVVAEYTGDGNAFAATLVDLAQRGYLRIDTYTTQRLFGGEKKHWSFTKLKHDDGLDAHESHVMELLFGHASGETPGAITSEELEQWANENRTTAHAIWERLKGSIGDLEDAQGFRARNGPAPYMLNILVASVVAAVAILIALDNLVVGLVGMIPAVIILLSTFVLARKTPLGVQRLAEYKAFGRFLRDFSELEHAPAEHVKLWERYLVYSVALGVSASLAKGLALKVPEVAQQGVGWYGGDFNDLGRIALLSTFANDLQSVSQPQSSGSNFSGGGGGFSSGGGGGGGGGGFGAS